MTKERRAEIIAEEMRIFGPEYMHDGVLYPSSDIERVTTAEQIERTLARGGTFGPECIYDGVIYPSGDGKGIAESPWQFRAISDTVMTLDSHFRDAPAVYVAGAMLIYYREGDNEARVDPDVFVVSGAKGKHPRHSWMTWVERAVPQFVLEVASVATWERHATESRRIYAEMGVAEYWRFDPEYGKYLPETLIGERLVDGEYVPMEVRRDEDGILRGYSDFLRLDLCVRLDGQIRLYDPAAGEWLLSHDESERELKEIIRERDENLRRADEAARRRDKYLREAERLRAELRALGVQE